jgi:hypothetical protein
MKLFHIYKIVYSLPILHPTCKGLTDEKTIHIDMLT